MWVFPLISLLLLINVNSFASCEDLSKNELPGSSSFVVIEKADGTHFGIVKRSLGSEDMGLIQFSVAAKMLDLGLITLESSWQGRGLTGVLVSAILARYPDVNGISWEAGLVNSSKLESYVTAGANPDAAIRNLPTYKSLARIGWPKFEFAFEGDWLKIKQYRTSEH